tara:strand:- start:7692 stop:8420 length:729 start_codon:yes stop_codon:yes gene_type:complete
MLLNIFKSKPTLKELIPAGFVDIHSHILPGIDDGAKNIEESILLISQMKKLGFIKIIGTPHSYPSVYDNTKKSITDSYNKLKDKIPKGIKIGYASEYMADISIQDKIKNNSILTIKDKLILIETGFNSMPNNLFEMIFEIRLSGYVPVIAHPERYIYLHENYRIAEKLKIAGCLFQINLLSSTGYYGNRISKFCDKLLVENMVDYVGSDIHNLKHIQEFESKVKLNNIKKFVKAIEANQIFI